MSSTDAPFRIVVYSAGGVSLGETANIMSMNNQKSLDKIGSCTLTIPAVDPIVPFITAGVYIDCFDEIDGYIGRYYFRERTIKDAPTGAMATISLTDNMVMLQRSFVGYRRAYNFVPVDQVVASLLSIAGWTGTIDTGIGNTTVDYEGESVFAAIDVLRDRWYQHYRLGSAANELEFGAFGSNSGLLLQNLEGQVQSLFEANRDVAHVSSISENVNSDGVYNRIIATSGGQGSEAELTIQNATGGTYPILSGLNQDGTNYYYIQDDASIALYGVRTKVVKFTGIRPLSNNTTDVQRAVNATMAAAEAYLRRSKDAIYTYNLDVLGLRSDINVGDVFHLDYRSITRGSVGYLDADQMLYLMDVNYSRDVKGGRHAIMTGCTTAQRRTSDTDIIVDVMRDVSVLKLHVQPYPYWSENTYYDTIAGWSSPPPDPSAKYATFKIEIDNSVTKLTKVRIRFKTMPLWTPMFFETIVAGEAPEVSALWQIRVGTNYPYRVRMKVNGTDVTSDFIAGGVWADSLPAPALDVTCDITPYIQNAVGGIYQNHLIEFTAENNIGAASVAKIPPRNQTNSNGFIECNIRVQGITQGIVPT